jgi:hypothetical protein
MPLDRNALESALSIALRDNFERGKTEAWDTPQAADEMAAAIADAVHAYVTAARISGVSSEVRNPGNAVIGTGTQTGFVNLS